MIFCYSVGAVSDLVRFAFFILQLTFCSGVVFWLEIFSIGSLYESVVFSVVFIACAPFIYFFLFAIYLCYFLKSPQSLPMVSWFSEHKLGLIFSGVSTENRIMGHQGIPVYSEY